MSLFPKAFDAIAKISGLDNRGFKFIEQFLSLEELSQKLLSELTFEPGASDKGPSIAEIKLSCATDEQTYQNIDAYIANNLKEFPADSIELLKKPIYTTINGIKTDGKGKKIKFRIHPHKIDEIARLTTTIKDCQEQTDTTYALRTYAEIEVYQNHNINFLRRKDQLADYFIN